MGSMTLKIGKITFHDQFSSLDYFFFLPLALTNGKGNIFFTVGECKPEHKRKSYFGRALSGWPDVPCEAVPHLCSSSMTVAVQMLMRRSQACFYRFGWVSDCAGTRRCQFFVTSQARKRYMDHGLHFVANIYWPTVLPAYLAYWPK